MDRIWKPVLGILFSSSVLGCLPHSIHPEMDAQPSGSSDSFTQGQRHFEEGYFELAIMELKRVDAEEANYARARKTLKEARARVARAKLHQEHSQKLFEQGQLFEARQELDEALRIHPNHQKSLGLMISLTQEIQEVAHRLFEEGRTQFEAEAFDQARITLLEALRLNPGDERILDHLFRSEEVLSKDYLNQGIAQFREGEIDHAVQWFEKAHSVSVSDAVIIDYLARAYNTRALRSYREEDLQTALDDLKKSLQVKPKQPLIQEQLRQIQHRLRLLSTIKP